MSTEFCVLENDRPAAYPTKAECWRNWKFRSYEEAFCYARDWLGVYGRDLKPEDMPLGKKYTYNGYDTVAIHVINNPY